MLVHFAIAIVVRRVHPIIVWKATNKIRYAEPSELSSFGPKWVIFFNDDVDATFLTCVRAHIDAGRLGNSPIIVIMLRESAFDLFSPVISC